MGKRYYWVVTLLVWGLLAGPALAAEGSPEDIHYLQALSLLESGQYHQASLEFQLALAHSPANPDLYFGLGVCLFQMNAYQEAYQAYLNALKYVPSPEVQAQTRSGLGDVYFQLEDFDSAVQQYRKALVYNKTWLGVRLKLSQALYKQHSYASALQEIKEILRESPHLPEAYRLRSLIHLATQDYPQALTDFEQAISTSPELDFEAYQQLNWLYRLNRRFEPAREVARSLVVNFGEQYPQSHQILGDTLLEEVNERLLKQEEIPKPVYDVIVTSYQKFLLHHPEDAQASYKLARAYQWKKDFQLAYLFYKRAYERWPGDLNHWSGLLELGMAQGERQPISALLEHQTRFQQEIGYWDILSRLAQPGQEGLPLQVMLHFSAAGWPQEQQTRFLFLRGHTALQAGEIYAEQGQKDWRQVETLAPASAEADLIRAQRMQAARQYAWSEKLYWQAQRKQPQWWLPYQLLGHFYFSRQEWPRALGPLEIAYRYHPTSKAIIFQLAEVYRRLARQRDLKGLYKLALQAYPADPEFQSRFLELLD